jgi:hypothetical protein
MRNALLLGLVAPAALAFASGCAVTPGEASDSTADSLSGSTISDLARANVGKGACSTNSKGGHAFDSSCTGNGGEPEYWCADFARWVWAESGVADTSQLTAAAGSFYVYGENHGTLHSTPAVGDAVVFNYQGGGVADHVAIVTQVNSNGTIETVSGDWGGESGSEAHFSSTSHTDLNSPAYRGVVGTTPGIMGMTISGFVAPLGVSGGGSSGGGSSPAPAAGCYSDTLAKEMPANACVQSRSDDLWYQCDRGAWVDRWTDPSACDGIYALPTESSGNGCYSDTLGKEMPNNACVQSRSDSAWYQCDNGSWTDRWTDPADCDGVHPL